ncbi:hypothetical protein QQP08_021569 [Theobroma cacao]|nr:hypothetical protein QQP08_021569 [Theobroma cacao]
MGLDAYCGSYSYSIKIAIKGQEVELEKIFIMFTSIDPSKNEFQGEIPKVVGKIPTQSTSLGYLEVLNLLENQLVGPIPQGNQFDAFGNDSYAGNLGLCGFPLSKRCDNTEASFFHEEEDSES